MRVTITTIPYSEDESADIRVHELTHDVQLAADLLKDQKGRLIGSRDSERFLLNPADIYYFETVDDRTFAYTDTRTFELGKRLYELEAELDEHFFRSSKSQIVNVSMIESVKSEMNGRMLATLLNGEKLIVSRKYVKELKGRLGL